MSLSAYWLRPLPLHRIASAALAALLFCANAPAYAVVDYTTNYIWDSQRRLVMTIAPDPGTGVRSAIKNTYNADGLLTKIEKGTTTSSSGSPFTVIETTTIDYDAVGNKIKETTPAGVTQRSYDDSDRLVCSAVRMNSAVYESLPSDACALSTEGALGEDRITKTTYDAAGQKTIEQRAYATSLQQDYATLTYTDNGKVATVKDANANLSTYEYDGFDRIAKLRFPVTTLGMGESSTTDYEQYGYDVAGNRTSLRKRSGEVIGYGFDALNREYAKDIPGTTSADVCTTYDLLGRKLTIRFGGANLASAACSASSDGVDFSYDKASRLLTEASYGRTLTYQYDAASNRTRVVWPDTNYVEYTYDAQNRMDLVGLNGVFTGTSKIADYAYDNLGRRTGLARGNGTSTTLGYDGASRLTSLSQDVTAGAGDITLSFTFSPTSQVLTRGISNTAYSYAPPDRNVAYVADGLNRYSTVGGMSYSYDARGNLTSDGARSFAYDLENRLIDVDTASVQTLALDYDPLGRLRRTTGAVVTDFLYDGDRLVAEYNGSGTLQRRYVHGQSVDEPLIWYEGSTIASSSARWLHADNQGSIIATTYDGGTALAYAYSAYGEPDQTNQWNGSRFRYTGQITLPDAKLYHYKARVYDPDLGRFLQTDPIGYQDQYNLYNYAGNDPVTWVDPLGTQKVRWFVESVKGLWKRVGEKAAQSARKAGKNVAAEGPGSVKKGKRLEEKVQGGKDKVAKHDPHPDGKPGNKGTTETHFQPKNRKEGGPGHTFVGPPQPDSPSVRSAAGDFLREAADAMGGTWEDHVDAGDNGGVASLLDEYDPFSTAVDVMRTAADMLDPPEEY